MTDDAPMDRRVSRDDLISYPFLLRPGVWTHLALPPDLTADDVRRIARMLQTLVVTRDQQS